MKEHEKSSLEEFLLDIDILDKLSKWINEVNFFEITKTTNKELIHSNILAWLFNSNENHNLKDSVVRAFIQKVVKLNLDKNIMLNNFDVFMLDFDSFTVKREWKNIDIFMISEEHKTTISIENKIYAVEREDQTLDYRKKVESLYPNNDYKNLYIYLTREGEKASDEEYWLIADYPIIIEAINQAINKNINISSTVKVILENYVSSLRRNILMDNELVKICGEIYKKHKTALDLIYEYRPDNLSNISEYIMNFIEENALKYNLTFERKDNKKSIIRFTTKYIESIVPKINDNTFGWGNGKGLMYEIPLYSNNYSACYLVISNVSDEKCQKLYALSKANHKKFNIANRSSSAKIWSRVFKSSTILEKEQIEESIDEIKDIINKKLQHLFEKEIPKLEEFIHLNLNE